MDADSSLDHVFFPDSGVVSVLAVYADGSVIEMATIGREGCTGIQAFFGAKTSSVRLLVQIPGSAAKMSRPAFARAMESMPSFRNLMSAYLQAFLEQVLVSVACNGAHSLKQRLARWLLMMRTAVTSTHCRSPRTFSPKCWVFRGQPSRMLPVSWNAQV
jgi:CRP-like cAMP-binding protein